MHAHVGISVETIPPHRIVHLRGEAAMAMNDVMQVSQAWDLVTRWAVGEFLQYLRQTVPEAENQWNVIKGSRTDCVPDDVYNKDFWNLTDPIQWEAAMTVCT